VSESARLKTSVPADQHAQFLALSEARGVSASKLLASLVWTAVKENPTEKI
jgi:hypothetical protein